jgi:hypothetical protein
VPDDQEVVLQINIIPAQPRHFPNPETKAIKQSEDHPISGSTLHSPRVVRKFCGDLQKSTGLGSVKEEWNALPGCPPRSAPHRGNIQQSLNNQPAEAAIQHSQKMVVTAWHLPGPGGQKRFDHLRRHFTAVDDALMPEVVVKE